MSELDTGAAPAAAEPSSATSEQVVQTPNPVRTDPSSQPADKQEAKEPPKPSAREAIANARKKLDDQEKAEAAKPVKSDPKAAEQKTDKPADKQPVKTDAKADTAQQKTETAADNGQQQQKKKKPSF